MGWPLRPLSLRWRGVAPTVGWLPVLALVLVAAIVGAVAWSTYRAVQVRGREVRRRVAGFGFGVAAIPPGEAR